MELIAHLYEGFIKNIEIIYIFILLLTPQSYYFLHMYKFFNFYITLRSLGNFLTKHINYKVKQVL